MDVDTLEFRERILNIFHEEFRKDSGRFIADTSVAEQLPDENTLVEGECKLMHQERLLDRSHITRGGTLYRITAGGVREFETTYDPHWQEIQRRRKANMKAEQYEKERKAEEYKKSEFKWTKIGIIGAIIGSGVSVVIAVFALYFSTLNNS